MTSKAPARVVHISEKSAAIWLLVPVLFAAFVYPVFYSPHQIDNWIYFGYFNNWTLFEKFPGAYYGMRLAHIVPNFLVHHLLSVPYSSILTQFGSLYLALLLVYQLCRKFELAHFAALFAALGLGFFEGFTNQFANDYPTRSAIVYMLLSANFAMGRRPYSAVLCGFFAALMINAHPVGLLVGPSILCLLVWKNYSLGSLAKFACTALLSFTLIEWMVDRQVGYTTLELIFSKSSSSLGRGTMIERPDRFWFLTSLWSIGPFFISCLFLFESFLRRRVRTQLFVTVLLLVLSFGVAEMFVRGFSKQSYFLVFMLPFCFLILAKYLSELGTLQRSVWFYLCLVFVVGMFAKEQVLNLTSNRSLLYTLLLRYQWVLLVISLFFLLRLVPLDKLRCSRVFLTLFFLALSLKHIPSGNGNYLTVNSFVSNFHKKFSKESAPMFWFSERDKSRFVLRASVSTFLFGYSLLEEKGRPAPLAGIARAVSHRLKEGKSLKVTFLSSKPSVLRDIRSELDLFSIELTDEGELKQGRHRVFYETLLVGTPRGVS